MVYECPSCQEQAWHNYCNHCGLCADCCQGHRVGFHENTKAGARGSSSTISRAETPQEQVTNTETIQETAKRFQGNVQEDSQ